ncbi:metal-dependent hydrolase [Clostridium sp. 19966]|uniref:metal-dependent hydrolase n=1 Tax=Clostridium sp. 19966 TaxID=2768166 RepID=UPI0028DEA0B3|nr:metal-dependent hydrolase [Clostridium sp. 19966]MDT8718254.1 metal-dependent hydrolase [Clostridium sp. 19966]
MLGKSHLRIGILSSVIITAVPAINSFVLFNNSNIHIPRGVLNITGVALAGLGALMVDADSEHSKINHMNPVTGVFDGVVGLIENILKTIISLLLTVGIGLYILYHSNIIINELNKFSSLKKISSEITYILAAFLILSGITGSRIVRYIPFVSSIYKIVTGSIGDLGDLLKKIFMKLVYIGGGAAVIYYSYIHNLSGMMYLSGAILIAAGIFPHRSFFHAIEGAVLVPMCVTYILSKLGYGYLSSYFIIGYLSHIYWADIFTTEGVPLSSIPIVLEKLGAGKVLKQFKVYRIVSRVLGFRLRIPPFMHTGSPSGNIFEATYVIFLCAIAAIAINKFGISIKII